MLDQHYNDDKEVISLVQDVLKEDIEGYGGIASAFTELGTIEGFVSMILEETNSMPSNEACLSDLRLFLSDEGNKEKVLNDCSLEPPFIWYMALTDNNLEEPFSIHCRPDGTYTNYGHGDSGYYTENDTDSDSD
ncbi:hypothetical protein LPJ55_005751 [Coemansia sp. RSA 990]|nr:hypothetical protein LPJ55_005751 [Coemansia sp. RSA 990]